MWLLRVQVVAVANADPAFDSPDDALREAYTTERMIADIVREPKREYTNL